MINIVAKREKNGIVEYLKSEYGNIFSRDILIDSIKNGHEYYILSRKGEVDKLYIIETNMGISLSTEKQLIHGKEEKLEDKIGELPVF